jgi:hypothetical protein
MFLAVLRVVPILTLDKFKDLFKCDPNTDHFLILILLLYIVSVKRPHVHEPEKVHLGQGSYDHLLFYHNLIIGCNDTGQLLLTLLNCYFKHICHKLRKL